MMLWSFLESPNLSPSLPVFLGVATNGDWVWKLPYVKKREELPWFQHYWLRMGPKPQTLQSSSESVSSEDAINNRKDKTHNPNLAHILFLTTLSFIF